MFVVYAAGVRLLIPADEAVRYSSRSPQAHYVRASVLADMERYQEAMEEFARAAELRPRDYFFWLELGRACDQIDDIEGARRAFEKAVSLAPHYAQPRWQLGNLLFRTGERDEAFAELRRAATSDPLLFPALADLAWVAYDAQADAVLHATQPQTDRERLALARFFVAHQETAAAINLFRSIDSRNAVEHQRVLVTDLLATGKFLEAYEVWSSLTEADDRGVGRITDGSIESSMMKDEPGFGWRPARSVQTISFALDVDNPRTGERSLSIKFGGSLEPTVAVLSQLVITQSNTRYRLHFAARTENLVSGGLPLIVVRDAASKRIIGQSVALAERTSSWRDYSIEFTTPDETDAIVIAVERPCSVAPCPIFGRVWLDGFTLTQIVNR